MMMMMTTMRAMLLLGLVAIMTQWPLTSCKSHAVSRPRKCFCTAKLHWSLHRTVDRH